MIDIFSFLFFFFLKEKKGVDQQNEVAKLCRTKKRNRFFSLLFNQKDKLIMKIKIDYENKLRNCIDQKRYGTMGNEVEKIWKLGASSVEVAKRSSN